MAGGGGYHLPAGLGLLLEEGEVVLDPVVDLLQGHSAAGPAVDCKLDHGHVGVGRSVRQGGLRLPAPLHLDHHAVGGLSEKNKASGRSLRGGQRWKDLWGGLRCIWETGEFADL